MLTRLDERQCECSSVVERQLPKLNVTGSSPVTRFSIGVEVQARKGFFCFWLS